MTTFSHLILVQIQWCGQVFEDATPIVCELLTDTLLSVDPSLPVCIERHLQGVDYPLDILIDLKQVGGLYRTNYQQHLISSIK